MTIDIDTALTHAADTVPVAPLDLPAIRHAAARRRAAHRTAWAGSGLAAVAAVAVFAIVGGGSGGALTVGGPGGPASSGPYPSEGPIEGVVTYPQTTRNHVERPVEYPQDPPVGGIHAPRPQSCGVYTAPIANTSAVHSMEHGAMWIAYGPQVNAEDLGILTRLVRDHPYRLLSPYPSLGARISLQAWGVQLVVDSASDPRVAQFADRYTNGEQTPERGSACIGTTATVADPSDLAPR